MDAASEGHREERVSGLGRAYVYLPTSHVLCSVTSTISFQPSSAWRERECFLVLFLLLNSAPGTLITEEE